MSGPPPMMIFPVLHPITVKQLHFKNIRKTIYFIAENVQRKIEGGNVQDHKKYKGIVQDHTKYNINFYDHTKFNINVNDHTVQSIM